MYSLRRILKVPQRIFQRQTGSHIQGQTKGQKLEGPQAPQEWNKFILSICIMCETFLESGRSYKLTGTMKSPLTIWNLGNLVSWNGTNLCHLFASYVIPFWNQEGHTNWIKQWNPPKNLESCVPGILESWNGKNRFHRFAILPGCTHNKQIQPTSYGNSL